MFNKRVMTLADIRRELTPLIQKQKLRYFGHLMRQDSLQRDLLEVMMEGKKGRGRSRAQWNENAQGWLEMRFLECKRKAERRKD